LNYFKKIGVKIKIVQITLSDSKGIRGEFGESIFLSTDNLLFGTIFEKWNLKLII